MLVGAEFFLRKTGLCCGRHLCSVEGGCVSSKANMLCRRRLFAMGRI